MLTDYRFSTPRDYDPAGYTEKEVAMRPKLQWFSCDDPNNQPPKLHHILAWDGTRTGECWLSADGQFMRINATWERVFGTTVKKWAFMPAPER